MENLLEDIPGVVMYLDEILVTGSTHDKNLKSLAEVLGED